MDRAGAGVGPVDLVDHDDRPQAVAQRLAEHEFGLRHRPFGGVDQDQHAVDHAEDALDLAAEIGMAGRVDDVDAHVMPHHRGAFRQDRDAALAFELVRIERPFGYLLIGAKRARLAQHRVDQGGLAVVDMGDDRDIADIHTVTCRLPGRRPRRLRVGAQTRAGLGGELRQIALGAGADMADDFGSAQTADPAADGERQAAGQAVEETAGVEIAGPGGVDHPRHRRRRDQVLFARRSITLPGGAAGQRRDRDMAAHRGRRGGEILGLVQRADLDLVGEQDVDMPVDQIAERGAMALDAERVGQRQRHLMPGAMGDCGGLAERLLRQWRVEQIAFEIGDLGGGDERGVDVVGPEPDAGAEIGVQGALPVGGDQDQAARRAGAARRRWRVEPHPLRGQIVAEYLAQQIVAHLADIGAPAAERGDPGHRVAGRSARSLDRRPHDPIERLGPFGVDQGHGPLDQRLLCEKRLVGAGDHIDNRIADAEDIDRSLGHARAETSAGERGARNIEAIRRPASAAARIVTRIAAELGAAISTRAPRPGDASARSK